MPPSLGDTVVNEETRQTHFHDFTDQKHPAQANPETESRLGLSGAGDREVTDESSFLSKEKSLGSTGCTTLALIKNQ